MKQYLEDLKESFYTDKYIGTDCKATCKNIILWIGNGCLNFTGWNITVHIPIYLRAYMYHHFLTGQSIINMKQFKEGEK